jgi:hypothetical protein
MNAREELVAAEIAFDELTEGGRSLVTAASDPQVAFCDGTVTRTWAEAAAHANHLVEVTREQIAKNESR